MKREVLKEPEPEPQYDEPAELEEPEEPVIVEPKKVKHRLPGIRLLRHLHKQRLEHRK